MSTFLSDNESCAQDRVMTEASTTTTPRPSSPTLPSNHDTKPKVVSNNDDSAPKITHSREPSSPSEASHRRVGSAGDDATHGESDGARDGSEVEADSGGGAPPSKKKKGQRFFCTDFPPCNLSFTRSEHLARHIRKHTGERPFQCHCSRRFSRLDNLRQHAQTVHVNEDIPGDSLAATGTRFQRQIRTERIRPQGRPRAGTAGSVGTHSRGHSRNLSTSSIASTASTFSQPEIQRRPPPLIMANDPSIRARLAMDALGEPPHTPPSQMHTATGQSATGSPYAPPHIFSAGGGSPHLTSPMFAVSHASGVWDGKPIARRLSVPTREHHFFSQQGNTYPNAYNTTASPVYPNSSSVPTSSPSSTYSSRDETNLSAAEAEMRRRTWHPTSYTAWSRPSTSGLNHYQTPDAVQPSFEPTGPGNQATRLPGIESFDKVVSQNRPLTPPLGKPSPMQVDSRPSSTSIQTPLTYSPANQNPPPISGSGHRRGNISWDISLHRGLTGLEIRDKSSLRDASTWSQQTLTELQNVGTRPSPSYKQLHVPASSTSSYSEQRGHGDYKLPQDGQSQTYCTGSISNGSTVSQASRPSPEDSSSSEGVHTPSTTSLEYHPAIVHSNGYVEPHQSLIPADSQQTVCAPFQSPSIGYHANPEAESRHHFFDPSAREPGMDRLEALVAVATSEKKAATKFFA